MFRLSILIANLYCGLLFSEITLLREIKLPGNFRFFRALEQNLFFAPEIGNRVFVTDSNCQITGEHILTAVPFQKITGFYVTPYSFFISDGDSIYQYHRRFGRSEIFYRSANIIGFVITEEGEAAVIDHYGQRVVFLDRFGQTKIRLTKYRPRTISYLNRYFWIAEPDRIVKIDEYGNEVFQYKIRGVKRIALTQDLTIFLMENGKDIKLLQDDRLLAYRLEKKVIDIGTDLKNFYGLNANGNLLLKYTIDFK